MIFCTPLCLCHFGFLQVHKEYTCCTQWLLSRHSLGQDLPYLNKTSSTGNFKLSRIRASCTWTLRKSFIPQDSCIIFSNSNSLPCVMLVAIFSGLLYLSKIYIVPHFPTLNDITADIHNRVQDNKPRYHNDAGYPIRWYHYNLAIHIHKINHIMSDHQL